MKGWYNYSKLYLFYAHMLYTKFTFNQSIERSHTTLNIALATELKPVIAEDHQVIASLRKTKTLQDYISKITLNRQMKFCWFLFLREQSQINQIQMSWTWPWTRKVHFILRGQSLINPIQKLAALPFLLLNMFSSLVFLYAEKTATVYKKSY